MVVGAGGMQAAPPPVDAAAVVPVAAVEAFEPPLVEVLSLPPQAATMTAHRTAPPMADHLLQVRTTAPSSSHLTLSCAPPARGSRHVAKAQMA
ncbi:MAG TPA: hypothetical protein VKB54_15830 [Solirubrobacteraceae bacterium]|nr:hypothetical protein [Solirubrobacteraceae bacterium]